MSDLAWMWCRASVAVVCFAAWTTLLVKAGFGPTSVFAQGSPPGGSVIWWFSPLLAFGAALYWFVQRVRDPAAVLVTGAVLVVLTGLFVPEALAKLPGDRDGVLYTFGYWQVAIVFGVVVGVAARVSKNRKPQLRPRPDALI